MDDTDSPRGGCTTWVLTELLALAREEGIDLIGDPRLVRLNPNIPWKTRGNAALSARFGRGHGHRRRVAEVEAKPVWSWTNGRPLPKPVVERFAEDAWDRVLRASRRGEPRTDPALVVTSRQLPSRWYYRAVREIVPVPDARRLLHSVGAIVRAEGDGRGIVGASASIAWPARRVTWELIAYRSIDREGLRRTVDAASVRSVARRFPDLFLCHDPRTRRLLVTPHTPCPILYGLRATDRSSPLRARAGVRSEPVDRWALFRTNQATGDHLVPRAARDLLPFGSGVVAGDVVGAPRVLRGGHVRLQLADREGTVFEAIAFEPTKTLPQVARRLMPGDRVKVWGSRGSKEGMKLEGLRVLTLAPRWSGAIPPDCPACRRPMRSLGTVRGYRCPGCRRRLPPEAAIRSRVRPAIRPGVYHPTPSARRHLAPLAPEP